MDWFRSAQKYTPGQPPLLITDLIDGESFEKLTTSDDRVEELLVLDRILFSKQTRFGNIWRNIVKLLVLPWQIVRLRRILRQYARPVIHAHSMYYIMLARFSGCKYVATPQGSELLVRPYRSRLYRLFASIGLSRATEIVVDSVAMCKSLDELFGLKATIIQNGIDVGGIATLQDELAQQKMTDSRPNIVSLRGFTPNYQIDRLVDARNETAKDTPIHFCYPFEECEYKTVVSQKLSDGDHDLGRLSRMDLHMLLLRTRLVVSIPSSDSSPRSVYEAIFCGCFVAVTEGDWINLLPPCMAARVIVVDLHNRTWLREALEFADANARQPYIPSPQALDMYDQQRSLTRYYHEVYPAA